MTGQVHFQAQGGIKHCPPPPWRDFRFSFPAPVTDGLDREPGGIGNGGRLVTERRKNVLDCAHGNYISEKRINRQGLSYPNFVAANLALSCDSAAMEPAFDIALVQRAMAEQKVTQKVLAGVAGITAQSAVSNIFKGKRGVSAEEAATIYRFLGLSQPKPVSAAHHVPIIGFASASSWRESVQMPIGSMSIPPKKAGKSAFAVEIQGDSIDKVVSDGGYVVVDPEQKELHPGKLYLIQNRDHETTIKCYARNPHRFEALSHNKCHKPIPATDVEVIIGRVVWRGDPL